MRFSKFASDLRVHNLRLRGARLGNNVTIRPYCVFSGCRGISIDDDVYIGEYSILSATDSQISIGAGTLIGPKLFIVGRSHIVQGQFSESGYSIESVSVGRNCWLGANVSLIAGVTVGDNSVVGTGSVVTRDIHSNVVAVGAPCRAIRNI
jgi:acetyltransferase-like isoleucine patch superfamily enzyme